MRKLTAVLLALLLICVSAVAEEANGVPEEKCGSIRIQLDGNETTGYIWNAFIFGGDCVAIDEMRSGYVSDPNPENLSGVGGKHYFKIDAVKPGECIVRLAQLRAGENEPIEEHVMLFTVADDLSVDTIEVTETGVYTGKVTEVNNDEHRVTLVSETLGEISAGFAEDETMPALDEIITIYTNGTSTRSLPPFVNVIAWSSVPSEEAR